MLTVLKVHISHPSGRHAVRLLEIFGCRKNAIYCVIAIGGPMHGSPKSLVLCLTENSDCAEKKFESAKNRIDHHGLGITKGPKLEEKRDVDILHYSRDELFILYHQLSMIDGLINKHRMTRQQAIVLINSLDGISRCSKTPERWISFLGDLATPFRVLSNSKIHWK